MKNILRLLTGYKRSLSNTISRTPNFFAPLRLCALIFLCAFAPLRDLKAQKAIHELPAKTTIDTNYLFIQGNPTTGKLYKTRGAALNAFISGGGGTATDTTSLSNRIDLKLNISDTVGLSNRIDAIGPHIDTTSLSNRIDAISSGSTDTTSLSNRIDAIPTISSFSKNAGRDSTILLLSSGTRYAVKDSIGAGGGGGSQTLDEVLTTGNTTDQGIIFNGSSGSYDFIKVLPIDTSASQSDLLFTRWSSAQSGYPSNEGIMFGFNLNAGGGQIDNTKPAIGESWEHNYHPSSARFVEKHEYFITQNTAGGISAGTQVRLSSYTINTEDNTIQLDYKISGLFYNDAATGIPFYTAGPGNATWKSADGTRTMMLNVQNGGNTLLYPSGGAQTLKVYGFTNYEMIDMPLQLWSGTDNAHSLVLNSYATLATGISNQIDFSLSAGTQASIRGVIESSGSNDHGIHFDVWKTSVGTVSNVLSLNASGSVAINGATAAASSILDITSTTKGFLPPRMTKTQRDAISSPATGLVVYQTDNTPGLRCYNGTNWMRYTETTD